MYYKYSYNSIGRLFIITIWGANPFIVVNISYVSEHNIQKCIQILFCASLLINKNEIPPAYGSLSSVVHLFL